MSFSNNCKPEKMPGPIKGNPVTGLCERACIQVDKVFDACIKHYANTDTQVTLTDIYPSDLTPPYKFISAASVGSTAEVANLVVSPLPDSNGCARVTANINIPVSVVFVDANGRQGVGQGTVTIPRDIIMHVPTESVMPYHIVADATLIAPTGEYVSSSGDEAVFNLTYCATLIMKVIMTVQLLVPSYGYACIPPCQEYSQDVCEGLFDLPLYPNEYGCQ